MTTAGRGRGSEVEDQGEGTPFPAKAPAEPGQTQARQVFFVSDSTGITAETLGNTLLSQFPDTEFSRTTLPFVSTVEHALEAVAEINAAPHSTGVPLVFSTAVSDEVRAALQTCSGLLVDLMDEPLRRLEETLDVRASQQPGRAHGPGNLARYQARMTAVEYALEHDDGQSLRALEKADVILVAPSRCGKTPTTIYLAIQHGIFAANFPLVDEDFDRDNLPRPLRPLRAKCFGLTSNPLRLSQVRTERRPGSPYASIRQCGYELRSAERLFVSHGIPYINSATMSVEEMSAMILHTMKLRH